MGLTPSVVDTLQGARVLHRRGRHMRTDWEAFRLWCNTRQLDPLSCGARDILRLLQEMLEAGKSPTTLRGMVAAIKAARIGPQELTEGCCDLINRFLKGACSVHSSQGRPPAPPWDLEVVLSALRHEPIEPLETVGLQWLSLKTAFLLAIVTAKRIGELHALSVHEQCCRFLPDDAGVVLWLNPAFHPKVWSASRANQSFELCMEVGKLPKDRPWFGVLYHFQLAWCW